jgi:cellulase
MAQMFTLTALAAALPLIVAQQIGSTPEVHPSLPTWKCTTSGGCVQQNTSIVLDWGFHAITEINSTTSCTTSSGVNTSLCPNAATCYANCAIEGANYAAAGISVSGDAMTMHQYVTTNGVTSNASPRTYLLGSDGDYEMLQLLGQELRYDVDVSTLVCGENGALYLSEMLATGGRSSTNPGGANYGSGYCDAQCFDDTWVNGTLNTNGAGACCNEMDIWEANANATALTPHPCEGQTCDPDGCGFNPYAQGATSFYGNHGTVNTLQPFTVITQFVTNDGTTTGTLTQINRIYQQNGVTIQNAVSTSSGLNSITAAWCDSSDGTASSLGGLTTTGKALGNGMVLVFSIWNDNSQDMNWLDSGSNGPCSSTAGSPSTIESTTPGTYVTFSNIRWGDIGSTFTTGTGVSSSSSSSTSTKSTSTKSTSSSTKVGTSTTSTSKASTTTTKTTTSASPTGTGTQVEWGQCGGIGYTGPTACVSPYVCTYNNAYYSQCLA